MDDYPLLNLFWTMLMFMFMVMWIWIVLSVFVDNFRREDHGGWAKALWTVLLVFLPFIGVLCYIVARPKMTAQDVRMLAAMREQQRVLSGGNTAQEIATAKDLLDAGSITQQEFDQIKATALSS